MMLSLEDQTLDTTLGNLMLLNIDFLLSMFYGPDLFDLQKLLPAAWLSTKAGLCLVSASSTSVVGPPDFFELSFYMSCIVLRA